MGENSSVARSLASRDFFAAFFIVVNSLSWYFPLFVLVTDTLGSAGFLTGFGYPALLALFGVHYVTVIAAALFGIFLVPRIMNRRALLLLWMIVGVVSTLFVSTLGTGSLVLLFSMMFALGVSLGLGFPTCLAYFADYGIAGQKGRMGGLTYCVAGLGIFSIGLLTILTGSLLWNVAILAVWRLIGLLVFLLVQPPVVEPKKEIEVTYRRVLNDRSFLLYLVPWLMFGLVNYLEGPILRNFSQDIFNFVPVAEFGVGSIVALIAGFFSDMVGRKRVVMFGFIMLGVGYAALGLFPGNTISYYFYVGVDGVAWGILALMFFLILWGEIAENRAKDKYYFLGVLPFLISSYLEPVVSPLVVQFNEVSTFSFASFFLFMAVLPLMYAPETLPQKNIELRRLRNYLDSAKKLKDKYPEN
jgi:MFS family permease